MTVKNKINQRVEDEIRGILGPRLKAAKTRQEMTKETASLLFLHYGIYPSAATVYKYTNHGSMGDINADLREFWGALQEAGRAKLLIPTLPDELVTLFSSDVGKLWVLALAQANATLDGEREEMAAHKANIERKLYVARQECTSAEDRANSSEQDMRQEREKREAAERRVEAQAAEIGTLRESVVNWQEQVATEAAARKEDSERNYRDLEAERAAKQRDMDMLDGEIRFAKLQIDLAREAERELKTQLKDERGSKEVELSAYRQRAQRAEDALGTARIELAELKERINGQEIRVAELQERIRALASAGRGTKFSVKRQNLRKG